ncbi:MAG: GNAT family N-acetyltransferase [Beijerinckiaceae bacterium]
MQTLNFRDAVLADLPDIIDMLADDQLGKAREDSSLPLDAGYTAAFQAIEQDPNHRLMVVVQRGETVGTFQLSFLPGLSSKGAWRGQLEAVRVHSAHRSSGIGAKLVDWAVEECRKRSCKSLQLTTNKSRVDAHRFYERLGFKQSHEGYKLSL